jgi:hypothetical protein
MLGCLIVVRHCKGLKVVEWKAGATSQVGLDLVVLLEYWVLSSRARTTWSNLYWLCQIMAVRIHRYLIEGIACNLLRLAL